MHKNRIMLFCASAFLLWEVFAAALFRDRAAYATRIVIYCLGILNLFLCGGWKRRYAAGADVFLLGFFLSAFLGSLVCFDSAPVRYHWGIFLLPLPFVYLAFKHIPVVSGRKTLSMVLVLSAAVVSFFGFLEFFGIKSFSSLNPGNALYLAAFSGRRMMSVFSHPAHLGTFLAAVFPFSLYLFLAAAERRTKAILILPVLMIVAALVLTYSRGSLAAFIAEIVLMALLLSPVRPWKIFAGCAAIIGLFVAANSLLADPGNHFTCRFAFSGLSDQSVISSRLAAVRMLPAYLFSHPLLGVGLGNFRELFDVFARAQGAAGPVIYDAKVADNMFVTLFAETGLFGFSFFVLFCRSIAREAMGRIRETGLSADTRSWSVCVFAGWAGILVNGFTYEMLYWPVPFVLFFAFAGMISSWNEHAD